MTVHKFCNKRALTEVYLGKELQVLNSSDVSKINCSGIVVDETKNMFWVDTKKGIKKIPKKECIFGIKLDSGVEIIDGKKICYNIAERIKKYA